MQMSIRGAFPLLLAAASMQAAATAQDVCPALAGQPGKTCIATAQGWFYARDRREAEVLSEDAAANAAAFARHFGMQAPRLAIVLTDSGETLEDEDKRQLQALGAAAALPWPTNAAHAAMLGDGLRKAGMPDAAIAGHPLMNPDMRRPVTRHELGHVLFTRAFFPDARPLRGHSNSNLPDWLNEMAAMLLEPDSAADHRRRMLRELVADPARASLILPLDAYFASENPAKPPPDQKVDAKGVSLVFRAGNDAPATQAVRGAWYAQTQAFADFLQDASGKPEVFADLTRAIARGGTVGTWLASSGKANHLPSGMQELQDTWDAWLKRGGEASPRMR